MRLHHRFDGVRNPLPAGERMLHAVAVAPAHRDAVADGRGVEFNRDATADADRASDGPDRLVEKEVAWDCLGETVGNADKRPAVQILVAVSHGPKQSALRRAFCTLRNLMTTQN